MTPHIPARRAAALRHGGAMAPATLSTQAPAARKRGGGPLRCAPLAASLAGRPSKPEGGAIKSLCCAAAGITPSPSQAHADVAYPTTSVRRGAEDAASLRFPLAPHAQLVEGYKHLTLQSLQQAGSGLFDLRALDFEGEKRPGGATVCYQLIQEMPLRHQSAPEVQNSLCHFGRRRTKHIKAEKKVGLAINHPLDLCPPRSCVFDNVELLNEPLSRAQGSCGNLFEENLGLFLTYLLSLLGPTVCKPSHPNRRKDRSYRTNSLNPRGGVVASPRPAIYPPPEQHSRRRKQSPHQQAARAQGNREFVGRHGHPLAINDAQSMPLGAEPVQGVEA